MQRSKPRAFLSASITDKQRKQRLVAIVLSFFWSKIPTTIIVGIIVKILRRHFFQELFFIPAFVARLTDGASRLMLHKNATAGTMESLDAVFVYNRTTARLVAAAGIIFTGHMF
jgi:hypothetical protein